MPNILFIEYWKEIETFKVLSTKFVGLNNESTTLLIVAELDLKDDPRDKLASIDLYPDKIFNLQGRDVVLSIFNYMPYVLWKDVVSQIIAQ